MIAKVSAACLALAALGLACKEAEGPPPFDASGCPHPAVQKRCADGWCDVPSGCFVMGSPESEFGRGLTSEEQAAVTLTTPFQMQQHEVTQAEWTAVGFPNPSGLMSDGTGDCSDPRCPVGNVTWFEALAYANALSRSHVPPLPECYVMSDCQNTPGTGLSCTNVSWATSSIYDCAGYRLPTEAECEYATRAGTRTAFYSGDITTQPTLFGGTCYKDDKLEPIAWYCNNATGSTHPVGLKSPNAWGLNDLSGNASEWVSGHATGVGLPNPTTDPGATFKGGLARVTRGGLFNAWSTVLRSASRSQAVPWDARGPGLGFRLVRSVRP